MKNVSKFIHTMLSSDETPDLLSKEDLGPRYELFNQLRTIHLQGGSKAFKQTWESALLADPSLASLVKVSRLVAADDLETLSAPDYILTEYPIYGRCLNALIGPSGTGKSFIALDIAAKLATDGKSVIYMAAEGLYGYGPRWKAWKKHHNIDNCPTLTFFTEPVHLIKADATEAFIEEIRPLNPDMIIIDTLARCMVGGNENDTRDMGVFIDNVDHINRVLGCGSLVVHHTGKNGSIRGNSSFEGACDSMMFLASSEGVITLYNHHDKGGKNKHNKEAKPMQLQIMPKQVMFQDELVEAAVIVPSEKIVQTADDDLHPNQLEILQCIPDDDLGSNMSEIIEITSISKTSAYRAANTLVKLKLLFKTPVGTYKLTEDGKKRINK